jgi:hypothetical protein
MDKFHNEVLCVEYLRTRDPELIQFFDGYDTYLIRKILKPESRKSSKNITSISIPPEYVDFIHNRGYTLSGFIRQKIEELMINND